MSGKEGRNGNLMEKSERRDGEVGGGRVQREEIGQLQGRSR